MAGDYHNFTVSVRVANELREEHQRNHSGGPWRGCRHSRSVADLFLPYASAGFQPGYHGLAPTIARATTDGGAMSAARHTADAIHPGPVRLCPSLKGFPSTFPPPDAKPRGTGRNGRGRRVTADAVGWPFVHVTSDDRDRVGMGRDRWGAEFAVCKIAGLRLPRFESWSCHTPPDLRKRGCWPTRHALGGGLISLRFRSAGRSADADRPYRAAPGTVALGPWLRRLAAVAVAGSGSV